ncbi:hypothetical protein [Micromonospora foliorum]|uniref:hypothetical protein n=1 Tax=Micromonospora foliorum TaxID=2911210 RepID=UPI001EE92DA2|nr:hypothetical protein [Micromonospora foliorum]MCG5435225.1 hypothetical protein [Micromonospora foliorum]
MSDDRQPQTEVDLTPHPLAPHPDAERTADENLTMIVGFVGDSAKVGQIRVYLDLSFNNFYEFSGEDVVKTKSVDPEGADSPRVLWVRSSAQVGLVRTDRTSGNASFVVGALRARFASRAVSISREFGDPIFEDPYAQGDGGHGTDWCYSVNPHLCPPPTSGVIFQCC